MSGHGRRSIAKPLKWKAFVNIYERTVQLEGIVLFYQVYLAHLLVTSRMETQSYLGAIVRVFLDLV